ncbi:P-loop containing nucleoside triphosphate hydrolase protein [Sphaerosporella brunnea]|uniref:P-loop containing nucleoside triphosphate hydrolase protein n=1 Tax=Sphaerosporella brunnea TaxID=1250544 RepID=A0A5J5F8K3_9PEZI|nr:P-loop containing nucleoside triphosphate hydrolase protein [Sphaerosporella brunnea]
MPSTWVPRSSTEQASRESSADISSSRRTQWFPDVYSPPFVSEYIRSINNLSAFSVKALPPPSIDFAKFVENFAGKGFLTPLPREPSGSKDVGPEAGNSQSVNTPPPSDPIDASNSDYAELGPDNYGERFAYFLEMEITKEDLINKSYNLYNVPVVSQDSSQYLIQVSIPGIRENTPMVQLGDMIKLRQIRPSPPGYLSGFTGYEYETYVYGLDRAVGYVVLRADGLWIEAGGKFNVIFGVQENRWQGARWAVADVGKALKISVSGRSKKNTKHSFLRRMLFPEKSDGRMQYTLSRGIFERQWIDKELNYEQQKAVESVLKQCYGSVPYLISGPPGTGKTKTLVEAVLQLIYVPRNPRHHILLCAPSQEAADTLALRLVKYLTPSALFRLQAPTRTFSEVPSTLMAYSHVENDMFTIPEWKILMRFRVVVCSCRDADILVQARCTNRDLGRWEKSVVDSLRGIAEDSPEFIERGESVRLHWSALLIDEAAQGIEPDFAIPLSVVAPPEEASDDDPIVVMAGDQQQLGPNTLTCTQLAISPFERLFSRALYSDHPWRRELYTQTGLNSKGSGFDLLTADGKAQMLPCLYPPFANLVRNYRSHPAILAVPSAFFYNDTLIPEATSTNRLDSWIGWKGSRGIPVKFILNGGLDESQEEGISFYNLREIQLAVNVIQSLLSPIPLTQSEIAVMSPFREQVKRLRKTLRAASLKQVNVGPVEAYQGAEYRFVIICTTRARERFLKNDREKGLGLVFEHRRSNVALTRAKEGLVVIGNPWILGRDTLWAEWMGFAWRHDAVEFEPNGHPTSAASTRRTGDKGRRDTQKRKTLPSSPGFSATATLKTFTSTLSDGSTPPVNEWEPRDCDIEASGLVSRLETALVFKSKAREGAVFGLNAGWDEDDPMFLTGIAAEEVVREQMEEEEN